MCIRDSLSGAGPSVASLCIDEAEKVGSAMVQAFKEEGINSRCITLRASKEGARCESFNP